MGVLAGVCCFDGRPTHSVRRAIAAAVDRSTGKVCSIAESGVVMVAESSPDVPPRLLRSPSGLAIAWDGRLDNRDDLRRQLGAARLRDQSDAAIAIAVFERRGVDGLRSLVGDWSAAVWDAPLRTLYLARDYMGVRPLYYSRDQDGASWSSSLGELAMRSGRADELDDGFIARFMALRSSTDVTPYRGIRAVPTGQAVRLDANGETRQRFWRLDPATIRYRDPRDYEDHLRAIWTDAVASRLRASGAVWVELSGGLDSSSILCMADALVKGAGVAPSAVHPISHVTFDSPEGDERSFINEVELWTGTTSTILGVERFEALRSDDDWATPLAPRGIQVASERHVGDEGGTVILSGRMGDLVMGCTSDNSIAVLDDFAGWRIARGLSNLRLWSRSTRKPLVEIGSTLVAEAVRAACRRSPWSAPIPSRVAGLDLLSDRLRPLVDEFTVDPPAPRVRWSVRRLAAAVLAYSVEARLENRSADPRVTYSYPFAHRPLVEYMLAVPSEELSAPGITRALMRRAFAGIVPDRILRRQSKGCYPPAAIRAVRRALASLPPTAQLESVRRGWLDAVRLHAAVHDITHGASQSSGAIQRVLMLEQWLARRHRRGPAAFKQREEVTHHGVCNA
jgi:asparagine synthase (glutamine-hydrolysing)